MSAVAAVTPFIFLKMLTLLKVFLRYCKFPHSGKSPTPLLYLYWYFLGLPSLGELVTTPLFDGEESYIAYPPLTNIHDDLRVELEFKPLERDGLIFFCGGKKMKVEDFVAISMVDGRVEFRYELGTGNS